MTAGHALGDRPHRIGLMPGDGIGPDVVAEAERVLEAVTGLENLAVELVRFPHSGRHYRATGELLGEESLREILSCEALLFGAAGDPGLPVGTVERALIVDLGRRAGLTIGIRPVKLHAERLSPLRGSSRRGVDLVVVRDIAEGELALPGGTVRADTPFEATASLVVHTRAGVDDALHHGFELAGRRRGKVTVVAQANALGAHRIWHERALVLSSAYPDVEVELSYPDAAAMDLVRRPDSFDVIVSTIMLGGILTDLGAALVGGMGLIPSVRLNPGTGFAVFEPAHGSAPKYAGTDRACPLATIEALAMLLTHIGEPDAGRLVANAVGEALAEGDIPDVSTSSTLGCRGATDAVIRRMEKKRPAVEPQIHTTYNKE
jgi:3-isopropylmalate dehydrogenase